MSLRFNISLSRPSNRDKVSFQGSELDPKFHKGWGYFQDYHLFQLRLENCFWCCNYDGMTSLTMNKNFLQETIKH